MTRNWYDKIKHAIRFWLLRRLPPCQQTVQVISQSFERELSFRERVLLKLHLWVCMWCVWYLEHLKTIRHSVRETDLAGPDLDSAATPGLSDEARDRIRQRLAATKQ
jgi:hypothetical protein